MTSSPLDSINQPAMSVEVMEKFVASRLVVENHYLHRAPNISIAFGLIVDGAVLGVCTFGFPASRHLQISVCATSPGSVIELNRLWVCDSMPKNSESWFVARCLKMMPPYIIVSYADTSVGHAGYIYRALNFNYAGWTDMERKTPRFDYVVPGKHSRQAFRGGVAQFSDRVRRKPKVKYWIVTGDRKQSHELTKICTWPTMCWKATPPPDMKMNTVDEVPTEKDQSHE
jgi:hypothetical protein